jgi:GT2 family glycosyltransferase
MSEPADDGLISRAVAVCVPTADRPTAVERVLRSVAAQTLAPVSVVVVDASREAATADVCGSLTDRFPRGALRHERAVRGLTLQRRRAVDIARQDERVAYIAMLDDDVILEPDFLARMVEFLESEEGRRFGGLSGYDIQGWGRPFERLERFYARIGLYDGELRPGRWLYCGRFLELSRLGTFSGVYRSDFIGGGLTVWRTEVFDRFLPPAAMSGYALLEDKHLSLRVATSYHVGVMGDAVVQHDRAHGGRPRHVAMSYRLVRRQALILRDCDAHPSVRRYIAFLGFTAVDLALQFVLNLIRLRSSTFPRLVGAAAGLASCVVAPPRRTEDALAPRSGRFRRYTADVQR